MNQDIITPFADAACQTFKMLLDVDTLIEASGKFKECQDDQCRTDVAIGITGDLSGEVLYRFPSDTTLEIVKSLSGMEFTEIDEFVTSALGEIANIISGNAVTNLTSKDITCDILPPRILKAGSLPADETEYIFSTKVSTQIGEVEIQLSLKADHKK